MDDQGSTGTMTQDEEKAQVKPTDNSSKPDDFGPAPDGGVRAWLVAFGSACIFFSCLGFMNAFGVFQEYYMTHQLIHKSPDEIAWIGSLCAFIQFAAGAIGGPMFDRYGAWVSQPPPGTTLVPFASLTLSRETDNPTSSGHLHLRRHDAQSLHGVLALYAYARSPDGKHDGLPSVPCLRGRLSIL
jgi:hypothetical protein